MNNGLGNHTLQSLRIDLNQAIKKYSQFPPDAKAVLSTRDFASFYILFRFIVDQNLHSRDEIREHVASITHFEGRISTLEKEVQGQYFTDSRLRALERETVALHQKVKNLSASQSSKTKQRSKKARKSSSAADKRIRRNRARRRAGK